MNGYELRRHLADEHGIHLKGMAYARMDDIHRGEHWPDPSRPEPDHGHDDSWTEQPLPGIPPG